MRPTLCANLCCWTLKLEFRIRAPEDRAVVRALEASALCMAGSVGKATKERNVYRRTGVEGKVAAVEDKCW